MIAPYLLSTFVNVNVFINVKKHSGIEKNENDMMDEFKYCSRSFFEHFADTYVDFKILHFKKILVIFLTFH